MTQVVQFPHIQYQILNLQDGGDLIFINKPAGISTHSVDSDTLGIVEILEQELKANHILSKEQKVYVVHRLDKTTTGCLLFALSEQKAKECFHYFKNHEIKKRYVFLTANRSEKTEIQISNHIEFINKKAIVKHDAPANSETLFKRIKINAFFQLWEALPKSGKPHQIRIHAAQAGIPILGDTLYGGTIFPHLCLHAAELDHPKIGKISCFHPIFFERMGLLRDSELCQILSSFDRRQRLFDFLKYQDQTLRLSHLETSKYRMDLFGEVLWVYWYGNQNPSSKDFERFEFLSGLVKRKIIIQRMQNRGQDPNSQVQWVFDRLESSDLPKWIALENGLKYEFRSSQGQSPGLFLDQRLNRLWIQQNSKNKKILNLFSYTCGFSLAAKAGGAKEIISVDLNKNFLEWGKRNFELNEFKIEGNTFFFSQNSLKFLEQAKKKSRFYDVIICDPPSFSRDGKNLWRIEKDLPLLLKACYSVLNPKGILFFSTNYEKWSRNETTSIIKKTLPNCNIQNQKMRCFDFEFPKEEGLMKDFFIIKGA